MSPNPWPWLYHWHRVSSLKVAVWRSHETPWCYAYIVTGSNGEVLANHLCVHDDYGNLMPVADFIRKTT